MWYHNLELWWQNCAHHNVPDDVTTLNDDNTIVCIIMFTVTSLFRLYIIGFCDVTIINYEFIMECILVSLWNHNSEFSTYFELSTKHYDVTTTKYDVTMVSMIMSIVMSLSWIMMPQCWAPSCPFWPHNHKFWCLSGMQNTVHSDVQIMKYDIIRLVIILTCNDKIMCIIMFIVTLLFRLVIIVFFDITIINYELIMVSI